MGCSAEGLACLGNLGKGRGRRRSDRFKPRRAQKCTAKSDTRDKMTGDMRTYTMLLFDGQGTGRQRLWQSFTHRMRPFPLAPHGKIDQLTPMCHSCPGHAPGTRNSGTRKSRTNSTTRSSGNARARTPSGRTPPRGTTGPRATATAMATAAAAKRAAAEGRRRRGQRRRRANGGGRPARRCRSRGRGAPVGGARAPAADEVGVAGAAGGEGDEGEEEARAEGAGAGGTAGDSGGAVAGVAGRVPRLALVLRRAERASERRGGFLIGSRGNAEIPW